MESDTAFQDYVDKALPAGTRSAVIRQPLAQKVVDYPERRRDRDRQEFSSLREVFELLDLPPVGLRDDRTSWKTHWSLNRS